MTSNKKTKEQNQDKKLSREKYLRMLLNISFAGVMLLIFFIIGRQFPPTPYITGLIFNIMSGLLASILMSFLRSILANSIAKNKTQQHPSKQSDVIQPPKCVTELLENLLPQKNKLDILGDLQEEFEERCAQFGYKKAAWWYRWQVLKTLWFFLWRIGRNVVQRIK